MEVNLKVEGSSPSSGENVIFLLQERYSVSIAITARPLSQLEVVSTAIGALDQTGLACCVFLTETNSKNIW